MSAAAKKQGAAEASVSSRLLARGFIAMRPSSSPAESKPTMSSLVLHGPSLDLQQPVEAGGRHGRLHFLLDIPFADEGIDLALRQAFVGLPHRLDHGRKGGPGGSGEAV